MREARRLALARRQHLLAQIARREAISGLADAVAEEDKTAQVAARSAQLVQDYAQRPMPTGPAVSLREMAAFQRSLQTIHDQASEAYADAQDQSRWQSQTLAAAQTKANRMEERLGTAKRELGKALERRELPIQPKLARRLQSDDGDPASSARGARKRKRP